MYVKLCYLQVLLPTACAVLGKGEERGREGNHLLACSSLYSLSEAEWQLPFADQHPMVEMYVRGVTTLNSRSGS